MALLHEDAEKGVVLNIMGARRVMGNAKNDFPTTRKATQTCSFGHRHTEGFLTRRGQGMRQEPLGGSGQYSEDYGLVPM